MTLTSAEGLQATVNGTTPEKHKGTVTVQWTYRDCLMVTTLPGDADIEAELRSRMATMDEQHVLTELIGEVV
jgi:hypothetical protein